MNRQERHKKASDVRSVISAMRNELKTASGNRKAELVQDISSAIDDYTAFLDDGLWGEDPVVDPYQVNDNPFSAPFEEPFEEYPVFEEAVPVFEEPVFTDFDKGFSEPSFDPDFDSVEYYMSGPTSANAEVPLGALEQNTNQFASTEGENRQHVSYILDRVAEVVSAIEKYEERQASTNKPVKSAGARTHIANHMKRLASVVHNADFKQASTGKHLDNVGTQVIAMHKRLVKA